MEECAGHKFEAEDLYSKTKKELVEMICAFSEDDKPFKLPNEAELSSKLGISRNVLRDVLMSLEDLGIVTRRRSKGTIANPALARITDRMDSNPELQRMLEEAGFTVRAKTLRLGFEFEEDAAFGPHQDPYLNVEKIFVSAEDDRPLAYCSDHISGKYAKNAGNSILALKDISHYEFLRQYCGTDMAYTLSHIDATIPQPWLADLMQTAPGDPLIAIDDYAYNYDHEVVVHSSIYYRHGELGLKVLRKSW